MIYDLFFCMRKYAIELRKCFFPVTLTKKPALNVINILRDKFLFLLKNRSLPLSRFLVCWVVRIRHPSWNFETLSNSCKKIKFDFFIRSIQLHVSETLSDTVVSYQNESFSSKWELPFLPPSSLELWRELRARKAALTLMKSFHFDWTLRYLTKTNAFSV